MKEKAIVLGTFDLTHYGHYRIFQRLKVLGFDTIACVTTDEFAKNYKRTPFLNLNERMENLRACIWVDDVIVNLGGHNSKNDIIYSGANHIVHGDDWEGDSLYKQIGVDEEWLKSKNIRMLYLPYTHGISTTDILGRVVIANELLKE
tara:strand:+ start:1677 stop:2117 length:441 start_codon:yes stop_codon:yes gene_type:complete